ncbi:Lsr2 family protein [Streptomyces sp. NPDC048384]|uniref:histone-like nucleoid-structuring protein Lsr2 n=1 Tax=Streptomyces sp. NPDC048384 TaxID=3155487 RepID=UPI003444FC82
MAQTVRVRLVDDIDGGEAQETVSFTFDGKPREIELSYENAAKFRQMMQPWMEASRPAKADNIAVKGAPAPTLTQAQQREEGVAIRAWCEKNHLPVNKLGRIPAMTRKAWEQHTRHGDRSLLDQLLAKAGIDPNAPSDEQEPDRVVRFGKGRVSVEDHLERRARAVGKLSEPQETRLCAACEGSGMATALNPADRSSYEALVRRGCMRREAKDTYSISEVGRTWVRLHEAALTA